MNREILFRGKSDIWNVWYFGYYVKCNDEYGNTTHWIIEEDGAKHKVISETVGRYTGLKDKSGNKIFEGDIVFNNYEEGFKIEYNVESAKFIAKGTRALVDTADGGIYEEIEFDDDITDVIDIIGNIHDNPELLKG